MEMYLRQSEDSELRVAAYLAVMKCPSDSVLTQVRQALLAEEVNQVSMCAGRLNFGHRITKGG